jgi:hypothetical protein
MHGLHRGHRQLPRVYMGEKTSLSLSFHDPVQLAAGIYTPRSDGLIPWTEQLTAESFGPTWTVPLSWSPLRLDGFGCLTDILTYVPPGRTYMTGGISDFDNKMNNCC